MIHLLNVKRLNVEWPNIEWPNIERPNIEWLNVENTLRRIGHNIEKDPTSKDFASKVLNVEWYSSSNRTEHQTWTTKEWTSKNSTASYYDIIIELF